MILSYHPCFEADDNRLCAGRQPDEEDRSLIAKARAVILPQGCPEALYDMARRHCDHVFPNYEARFRYPGKTGQARLMSAISAPCPRTWGFPDTTHAEKIGPIVDAIGFPLVFKLDWGGEGDTVSLLSEPVDLDAALSRAAAHERSGNKGFVVQQYIPHGGRTLRVVVIGRHYQAYWRIQDDPLVFGTSMNRGARIDHLSDPHLRESGEALVKDVCRKTRINLAGFDVIFDHSEKGDQEPTPMLLEINYFFGRRGLGGSEPFYDLLQRQIEKWLDGLPQPVDPSAAKMGAREKP